jgi:hypothetical protein
MRAALIGVLLSAAACQCLVPVTEHLDGGEGGGSGGGAAGGAGGVAGGGTAGGPACAPAQCPGPPPASSHCSFGRDAGFSCIDEKCVFECFPGRTCDTADDAGCLTCATGRSCAPATGCNWTAAARVIGDNGCAMSLPSDLMLTPLAGVCGWAVTDAATGRALGSIYRLDDGSLLAHLGDLGGTCVGFSQGMQVERWMFSCPACQVEIWP